MKRIGAITACFMLLVVNIAYTSDSDIRIEAHSRLIECASFAFLSKAYRNNSDNLIKLAADNLDELVSFKKNGDKTALSWFEFQSYEILTRDYILGYDYGSSLAVTASRLREEHGRGNDRLMTAKAEGLYREANCAFFEKLFR